MFSLNRTISIHELNVLYIIPIGIVPITCEELFKGIEAKRGTEAEYQVVLNMLEIYNEQVCIIFHSDSFATIKQKATKLCLDYNQIRGPLYII